MLKKDDLYYFFNFVKDMICGLYYNLFYRLLHGLMRKTMGSPAVGQKTEWMSVSPLWSNMQFNSAVSMLISWIYDLSTEEGRLLTYPNCWAFVPLSLISSINNCFLYLHTPVLDTFRFRLFPLTEMTHLSWHKGPLSLFLAVIKLWCSYGHPYFLLDSMAWNILLHPFTFSLFYF